MNTIMDIINNRKSVRAYEEKDIPESVREEIIKAAMRAPTAGNMMLYSIIEVADQKLKETLSKTCDNQPFIAKAPFVLIFLADYQRWVDYYVHAGVPELCEAENTTMHLPEEGSFLLACSDAIIAAQNAVIAAESFGVGSCYIGDIIENYEEHKKLLDLPDYVFPIGMLCFGYPTQQQKERELTSRFDKKFVVFKDKYKRLSGSEFDEMYRAPLEKFFSNGPINGAANPGQQNYIRKFNSDFTKEMDRSARAALENWKKRT